MSGKFFFIILVFLSFSALYAQDTNPRLAELEKEFRAFNYHKVLDKGSFFLEDPLTNKQDSLSILTFMLNSAYALNDTIQAKNFINLVLRIDPEYSLNPRNTSPKIIELFNLIKNKQNIYPSITDQDSLSFDTKEISTSPWPVISGVIFPGSGHLLIKEKRKGYIFSAVTASFLSGIALTTIKTNEYRDNYRSERSSDFNNLYNRYNDMYKIRNGLLAAYILYNLYTLFDLTEARFVIEPQLSKNKNGFNIILPL